MDFKNLLDVDPEEACKLILDDIKKDGTPHQRAMADLIDNGFFEQLRVEFNRVVELQDIEKCEHRLSAMTSMFAFFMLRAYLVNMNADDRTSVNGTSIGIAMVLLCRNVYNTFTNEANEIARDILTKVNGAK